MKFLRLAVYGFRGLGSRLFEFGVDCGWALAFGHFCFEPQVPMTDCSGLRVGT